MNGKDTVERYKKLFEYNFYSPTTQLSEDDTQDDATADAAPMSELPQDSTQDMGGGEGDMGNDMGGDMSGEGDMSMDMGADMVANADTEEVEVDVTELVDKQEELKSEVDQMSQNLTYISDNFGNIMNVVNMLSTKVGDSLNMTAKEIQNLKGEVVKRNPTENEKLKIRSLDSFPYNVQLDDYWDNKSRSGYEVDKTNTNDTEEFVLRQGDVDADFNESDILKTMDEAKDLTLIKMFNL